MSFAFDQRLFFSNCADFIQYRLWEIELGKQNIDLMNKNEHENSNLISKAIIVSF